MKKKVLITLAHNWARGGVQIFFKNVLEEIKKECLSIDIFVPKKILDKEFEKEIKDLGVDLIIGNLDENDSKYNKKLNNILTNLIKGNNYDIVHSNTGIIEFNFLCCRIAKKQGVSKIVIHSHNAMKQPKNPKILLKNFLMRKYIMNNADILLACSEPAAYWMFRNDDRVKIIHNGIKLEKFLYDNEIRDRKRKELNVENNIVIGNVGNFNGQKNHKFLIDVFEAVYNKNKNAMLLLLGSGKEEAQIKQKVHELNLDKVVRFMGTQKDINEYMQAMDVFAFPSLYEGFGIVLLEAQATGLKSIVSTNIPKDAIMTDLVKIHSLDEDVEIWADEILKKTENNRRSRIDEIRKLGYDIKDTAKEIEKIYMN